ncbi:MAG: thermonuclease family protein [Candidatus Aminicenantes bacterium]|nr:thermonuclease family protein [Candidatus Aminicenantes bacterium]
MKKICLVRSAFSLVVLAAAILIPASSLSAPAEEPLRGTVTVVYDGDTVRVRLADRKDERVRLIGVDSPELDDAREQVRLMAFLAKRFAFTRLFQSTVELLPGPEERDVYGRLLAYIRTTDGEMFNETLVREGYAYAYLKFPFDEAWKTRLKDAESSARRSGKGLWQKTPYPVIGASEAGGRPGEIVTVRFPCLRSFKRGGFRILEADGAEFDAVIPLGVFKSLPGSLDFSGRTIEATGFVELYKGRPQIMIGVPVQLKRVD